MKRQNIRADLQFCVVSHARRFGWAATKCNKLRLKFTKVESQLEFINTAWERLQKWLLPNRNSSVSSFLLQSAD